MASLRKLFYSAFILVVMMSISCSDDSDPDPNQNPNNPPPPPGGEVTITSVEGGNMFWGDEMTITGTGFSAVKEENNVKLLSVWPTATFCNLNYTSASGGVIEIISASTTQLKVKIPVKLNANGDADCGPEKATLEITVNGKKGTKEGLRFHGWPRIGEFNYHYGWFDIPTVTRIGDSVMLDAGMHGWDARESDLWDDIKISIDGNDIETKYRTIGLESGFAFYLDADTYGEMNCSDEPDGWAPARKMNFTISVGGKSASKELYVQYLPAMNASCDECPASTEALNSLDPVWKITGSNIYYTEARFTPIAPCSGPSQGVLLTKDTFADEFTFTIPLSILADGCSYSVTLADPCGRAELIGSFSR